MQSVLEVCPRVSDAQQAPDGCVYCRLRFGWEHLRCLPGHHYKSWAEVLVFQPEGAQFVGSLVYLFGRPQASPANIVSHLERGNPQTGNLL